MRKVPSISGYDESNTQLALSKAELECLENVTPYTTYNSYQ